MKVSQSPASSQRRFTARAARAAAALALLLASPLAIQAADNSQAGISEGYKFSEKGGENLYRAVCQGCHMAEGQGAKGAGMYPALAANPRLAASTYPVYNILNGRKGMPSFKMLLSDEQVADVTNYVRTHMGNDYKDAVSVADVKAMR